MKQAAQITLDRLTPHAPLVLALASTSILAGAYVFQYGFGYEPCDLCWEQRYPYMAVVVVGGLATLMRRSQPKVAFWLLAVAVLALFYDAGMAAYHVGVEQKWWLGPTACSSNALGTGSADELLAQLSGQRLVRCDEPAWTLFSISLAGYNVVLALGLALFGGRAWLIARNKGPDGIQNEPS